MKTRVQYHSGRYYPQVRTLFFFWKDIYKDKNVAYFTDLSDALVFIHSGDWEFDYKIVWSSK